MIGMMTGTTKIKFYRYEIRQYSNYGRDMEGEIIQSNFPPRVALELLEFELLRETPMGFWICNPGFFFYKKWVSKTARKRYAYPTKAEAMKNFIKRTEKRVKILLNQVYACEEGLKLAKYEQTN